MPEDVLDRCVQITAEDAQDGDYVVVTGIDGKTWLGRICIPFPDGVWLYTRFAFMNDLDAVPRTREHLQQLIDQRHNEHTKTA